MLVHQSDPLAAACRRDRQLGATRELHALGDEPVELGRLGARPEVWTSSNGHATSWGVSKIVQPCGQSQEKPLVTMRQSGVGSMGSMNAKTSAALVVSAPSARARAPSRGATIACRMGSP